MNNILEKVCKFKDLILNFHIRILQFEKILILQILSRLGFILGAKIYIDFAKYSFDECIKKLNKQIILMKVDNHRPLKIIERIEVKHEAHEDTSKEQSQDDNPKINVEDGQNKDASLETVHQDEQRDAVEQTKEQEIEEDSKTDSQNENVHKETLNIIEGSEEGSNYIKEPDNEHKEQEYDEIIKNYSNTKTVNEWVEIDVDNWFTEKKINNSIKANISPCDGKVLEQLFKMSIEVPEFFYSCLRNDTKANLKDLAFFATELRVLNEKKN